MKPYFLALMAALISTQSEAQTIAGGDADKHGCRASAGYTWSIIRAECIRVWETGTRLHATDSTATTDAFVIFDTNRSKAEIWANNTHAVLNRSRKGSDTFIGTPYRLVTRKQPKLYKGRRLIFISK
ncbi:MAG: hypothetical protein IAE95_00625 [Chitinophagaceae bacterium]|nr:hypothetical protein [Chitinophagaceae bacterium]